MLIVAGMVGAVWSMCGRHWRDGLVPVVWLAVAGAVLAQHHPVWYHQMLLVTVPLVWLAALGVGAFVQGWRRYATASKVWLRVGMAIAAASFVAAYVLLPDPIWGRLSTEGRGDQPVYRAEIVERMRHDTTVDDWVYSDRPLFAFDADRRVPPEVAVVTGKRIKTGNLTTAMLLEMLDRYQPKVVYIERFKVFYGSAFRDRVIDTYDLQAADAELSYMYFVRKPMLINANDGAADGAKYAAKESVRTSLNGGVPSMSP